MIAKAGCRPEGGACTGPQPRGEPQRALPSTVLHLFPAFQSADFRLLWAGLLPGTLAWMMGTVAVPYAAFSLSGAATTLGAVNLAIGVPLLVLSLLSGILADRLPRRAMLLVTQGLLGLAAAALAVLSLAGLLQVWHLIAVALVQGTAYAFQLPGRQAYIADLVGRPRLRSAVALNNATMNFCRVAGPAAAGALLSVEGIGLRGVFWTMVALYGLVLSTLLRLPAHAGEHAEVMPRGTNLWADLLEGLRYIRSSSTLAVPIAMGFLVMLFGMPFQALLPVFAERVYDVGAGGSEC